MIPGPKQMTRVRSPRVSKGNARHSRLLDQPTIRVSFLESRVIASGALHHGRASDTLDEKKIATGVFNYQRVRVGTIVFEVESPMIEKAEIHSVTSGFADC
ncbi:MAG: hypothetical protein QOH71_1821 [Blastocatellia bacterium]|nr:hypothetical protein [Blastocatellia bacterium]